MKKFLSLKEAIEAVTCDENDTDSIVIIPPDANGGLTDEEEGEGDVFQKEVSGTLEATSSRRVRYALGESADREDQEDWSAQPSLKKRRLNG